MPGCAVPRPIPPTSPVWRGSRTICAPGSSAAAPGLPQKLPSDILTLQSKGHLNLVATSAVGAGQTHTSAVKGFVGSCTGSHEGVQLCLVQSLRDVRDQIGRV